MTGSVRRRGKTWTAYWWSVDAATGRRKQESRGGFRTKKDAQDHLTEVLPTVRNGTFVRPSRVTLEQYVVDSWLPSKRSENHRPTTMAQYEVVAEKWIIPHLGGLPLTAITPAHVEGLRETLKTRGGRVRKNGLRSGLGERSVQRAAVVLRMILEHAVKHGKAPSNPAASLKLPKVSRSEMSYWTEEESLSFLRFVESDRLAAAWALFLVLGMRRGEVCGLRWQDLDIDDRASGRLRIVHTRVVGGDNAAVSSTPKTEAGRRSIALDAGLVSTLRAHKARQLQEQMAKRPAWTDSGYVFVRPDGMPFHPDHFSSRFDELIADANKDGATLRRIRLHDCRHSAATQMLANGEPVKVVAELLGHADISITLRTYAHVLPNMGATAVATMSGRLLRGGGPRPDLSRSRRAARRADRTRDCRAARYPGPALPG